MSSQIFGVEGKHGEWTGENGYGIQENQGARSLLAQSSEFLLPI